MLDKMAMKDAASKLLSSIKNLDMSKVRSVTIEFKDHPDAAEEAFEPASYHKAGSKEEQEEEICPDCGAEMEHGMCPECEYEDVTENHLQKMKKIHGIPHMLEMKKYMDKGLSPLQAHKKAINNKKKSGDGGGSTLGTSKYTEPKGTAAPSKPSSSAAASVPKQKTGKYMPGENI